MLIHYSPTTREDLPTILATHNGALADRRLTHTAQSLAYESPRSYASRTQNKRYEVYLRKKPSARSAVR